MAIDAGIVGRLQPVQMPDQMNMLAKAMQIKEAQSNQQINALKMDEYKRGLEDQNALRTALSQPGADPYSSLLKIGKVKEATEYAKGQADIGKTKAEAEYKAVEVAHKRVDSWGQAMGWLRQNPTPENAVASIQHLVTMGVMPREQAQAAIAAVQKNPTPQGIAQFADMGFRTALQAKDQLPKFQTNNIGGQTVTQQIDPVTGQAVVASAIQNTQSPDNIATNARVAADAAASRAQTERHFQTNQSAGKVPSGYRQKPDGTLEFIPGGPADPNAAKKAAPTEFQGKAGMFGNRAAEADRIITELEGKYSPAGINAKQALGNVWGVGGALEAAGNKALSNESQKAEQAQRDFVNAVLRLESGAAIGQSEFDNARKQYFRQPGDSEAVVAQKAANRKTAIQGLMNNARPGGVEQTGGATGSWGGGPGKVVDFGSLK